MSAELIHKMYIAYYQRPADPAGLVYWLDEFNKAGGGTAGWNAIAGAFANAPESQALFGTATLGQKISAIYLAAFERAASAEEVAYWEASGFNAAQIGFAVVQGAQNDDLLTVAKKVDYSEAFVSAIDPAGTGVGPFDLVYDDPSIGRNLMDVITKDSDVSASTVSAQATASLPVQSNVNLTSGQDSIAGSSDIEVIGATLGGSAPTLGRTDTINGGSGTDVINVDADGNFLLGFSTGYMSGVETMNIASTVSSVTPRIFNFAGTSGLQTINVGAANAKIELKNVNDTGLTVNLSGQTSGTFKLDYASGAISGTGSALALGVADLGSNTGSVILQADGITDLTVNSTGGYKNYLNVDNAANDLETLVVQGNADLELSDIGANVTAVEASGMLGDFTLVVDTDSNQYVLASAQSVVGGAGHDIIKVTGTTYSVKASTTNVEELFFDAAKPAVKATGMESLTTLSFSGQNAGGAVSISGLRSGDLTVNAIMNNGSAGVQTISAAGNMTVNLNASEGSISNTTQEDNDFGFKNNLTTQGVTINVGSYVSGAGTHTMDNAANVTVNVDSTSDLGGTLNADKASTVSIAGGATHNAITVNASAATTISMSAVSGTATINLSSNLETVTLDYTGGITISSGTDFSGLETLTVNSNQTADLSNITTNDASVITVTGTSGTLVYGTHSSDSDVTFSLSGLAGGFSAGSITTTGSQITIDASNTTGSFNVAEMSATTTNVVLGSTGMFSAGDIDIDGDVTISGANSGSVDITLTDVTAQGDVTVSMGTGSGQITVTDMDTDGAITMDWSKSMASATITSMTGEGTITMSYGDQAEFNIAAMKSDQDIIINGAAHTTGSSDLVFTAITASASLTISLGAGSGAFTAGHIEAGTDLVIDGGTYGGEMDLHVLEASGGVTLGAGTAGNLNVSAVNTTVGDFILTGNSIASDVTASLTLVRATAAGNITISVGGGNSSGLLTGTNVQAGEDLTVDAGAFAGSVNIKAMTASGSIILNAGDSGAFSGQDVIAKGDITFDSSGVNAGATADILLNNISGSGAVTISLGNHEGVFSGDSIVGGNVTVAADNYAGTLDLSTITASGNLIISAGTLGDFSGNNIDVAGDFTFTNAANTAKTADITLTDLVATGDGTFALGTGPSGTFLLTSASITGDVSFDGSGFKGAIDITKLNATGDMTISSGTRGDFSAGSLFTEGALVLNGAANASVTADVALSQVTASGAATITLGDAAGAFSAAHIVANGVTISTGNSYTGSIDVGTITSSGAMTISLGTGGDFSASGLTHLGAFTFDNSSQVAANSGGIVITTLSGSGAQSITLGAGSGTFSAGHMDGAEGMTLNASGFNGTITGGTMDYSGAVVITTGKRGEIDVSAIEVDGSFTLNGAAGICGTTTSIQDVSAGGAISITLGAGSASDVFFSSMNTASSFTLDASNETGGALGVRELTASAAITVNLGVGMGFTASGIATGTDFTLTSNGSGAIAMSTMSAGDEITITLAAGSSTLTLGSAGDAVSVTANGAMILDASGSIEADDQITLVGNIAASGLTIKTGTVGTLHATGVSSLNIGGDMSIIQGGSGGIGLSASSEGVSVVGNFSITMVGGTAQLAQATISGTATLTVGGSVTLDSSAATRADFQLGDISGSGVSVVLGGSGDFSAGIVQNTGSADITFTMGEVSADITLTTVSSVGAATFNLGTNTGDLYFSSLDVASDVTINGGGHQGNINIAGRLSASGVSITLGETADDNHGFSASSIIAHNVTVNANSFNDEVDLGKLSASGAVTITVGENVHHLTADSIQAASGTFTLNAGGAGSTFSASLTEVILGGGTSGWTISLADDGKNADITMLKFSAGGSYTGTGQADNVSAESSSLDETMDTYTFDLRDDGVTDTISYVKVASASDQALVILKNFQGSAAATNSDVLKIDQGAAANDKVTAIGFSTAAQLLTSALGETVTSANLTEVANTESGGTNSSMYTYNGDTYYLGYNSGGTGTFGSGDVIFKFVGTTDVNYGDITGGKANV